ncbi:MAG: asparagine synthase (glutamine-hydrolyzing), partial [Methanosarcinales archaeon]
MCSICGFYSKKKVFAEYAIEMLEKMEHRGPDGHGISIDGQIVKEKKLEELNTICEEEAKVCLGHSRLKIVGGQSEIQPFQSSDKRLTLVHNGEIYNYKELKSLLSKPKITGDSDSEILLHLIEEYYEGDLVRAVKETMQIIDGMYAFAVTDQQKIVVARDPVGIKPIYYTDTHDKACFASEKKAIISEKKQIRCLLPGNILEITKNGTKIHNGVEIEKPQIDVIDCEYAIEYYKKALQNAVRKRASDYKDVGVIFSGGVDSALIAKILKDIGKRVKCYCVGTGDSDDIENAKKVASDLGLELKTAIINEENLKEILPDIIETIEFKGLVQVEVAVPMYLAAKMASEDGIRVMFTGQGADELFAGYWWYKDVVKYNGHLELHHKLWEDIELLYDDTLEREDKVTMAHSIELRVPYLDREVIRTAMKISPKLKIKDEYDEQRKWVHRIVAHQLGVPDYIAFRKKDMAQSGSGVHGLIDRISKKYFKKQEVGDLKKEDKG